MSFFQPFQQGYSQFCGLRVLSTSLIREFYIPLFYFILIFVCVGSFFTIHLFHCWIQYSHDDKLLSLLCTLDNSLSKVIISFPFIPPKKIHKLYLRFSILQISNRIGLYDHRKRPLTLKWFLKPFPCKWIFIIWSLSIFLTKIATWNLCSTERETSDIVLKETLKYAIPKIEEQIIEANYN